MMFSITINPLTFSALLPSPPPGPFSLSLLLPPHTWLPAPYAFTFFLDPVFAQEGVVVSVGALEDIDVFGDLFPAYTQVGDNDSNNDSDMLVYAYVTV